MWGFITVLNDNLIPHLKGVFELGYADAMLVQSAFFGAYFIGSLPAGWFIGRIGYRRGIVVGLAVTGAGALLFFPAAAAFSYALFLAALFVLATGITVLQVAANPYVTVLGEPHTASSRLNLTQGLNSLGTTLGPQFGVWFMVDAALLNPYARARSVQWPYVEIAITLFVLAIVFSQVKLPSIAEASDRHGSSYTAALRHRTLRLGVGAIFVYVGAEVAIGSAIVFFLGLPEIAGMPETTAGRFISFYWGAAMIGRFVGAAVQQWVAPSRVLAFAAALAVVLIGIAVTGQGAVGMWALLAVGLANSVMFPTIFALSIAGLGEQTSRGAGLLVMAIVGGAIIPWIFGLVADAHGLPFAISTTTVCYGYIVYFALTAGRGEGR